MTGRILTLQPFPSAEHARPLPGNALFLCAYELHLGVDYIVEAAFLQTTRKGWLWGGGPKPANPPDALWLIQDAGDELVNRLGKGTIPGDCRAIPSGTAVWQEDPLDGAELFLDTLTEARLGFSWPRAVQAAGLVDAGRFQGIVARVKGRVDARAKAAEAFRDAPIVAAARELGLHPRPSGTGEASWRANCPAHRHFIMISGDTNQFACGWCNVHGGPAELRSWVTRCGKG